MAGGARHGFGERYGVVVGIVLSVAALVVAVVALWPAFVTTQVLRNPDLRVFLTRLRSHLTGIWFPSGCGGGPGAVEIAYDFVLPGDADQRPAPVVLDKDIQFIVEGKSVDRGRYRGNWCRTTGTR